MRSQSETAVSLRASAKAARDRIKNLAAGESLELELPGNSYVRRELYRRIGTQCHRHLGAGNYRLQASGEKIIVTRATGGLKRVAELSKFAAR